MEDFDRSDDSTESSLPIRFDIWLRMVMYNILSNYITVLQRNKDHFELCETVDYYDLDEESDSWDPYEGFDKDEVNLGDTAIRISDDRLAAGVKRLTKSEKEILGDIFVHELSTKEIAEKRNLSPHTVSNKKNLIIGKLKRVLEEVIDDADET